jgi:hypothetical protein
MEKNMEIEFVMTEPVTSNAMKHILHWQKVSAHDILASGQMALF